MLTISDEDSCHCQTRVRSTSDLERVCMLQCSDNQKHLGDYRNCLFSWIY